jgi:hypothetical protein
LHLTDAGALAHAAMLHDYLRDWHAFLTIEDDAALLTAIAADDVELWRRELAWRSGVLEPR